MVRQTRWLPHRLIGISTIAAVASVIASCTELLPPPVTEATMVTHRTAPPEMMALCPTQGLQIFERVQGVTGVRYEREPISNSSMIPGPGPEIETLLWEGYGYVEVWAPGRDLRHYALGRGYHRYSVKPKGSAGCEMFERDVAPFNPVWHGIWSDKCVSTELIDAPTAEYVIRKESKAYADHPRGQIWLDRDAITRSTTGEVLAEKRYYTFRWSDLQEHLKTHSFGIKTKGCENENSLPAFRETEILVPVTPGVSKLTPDELQREYKLRHPTAP